MSEVIIYQAADGKTCLEVQLDHETVWLNQAQMVDLFQRDQSVLSRHIRNVFKEGELEEKSNMQKMHIANSDKLVVFYNLDVIISVGYRVKSRRGTQFRSICSLAHWPTTNWSTTPVGTSCRSSPITPMPWPPSTATTTAP